MSDYHCENDAYCAQWLRNLMKKNLIPDGYVDERDIRDVEPVDLYGFTRHHFFSGLAGWPCALRLAGIPDNIPLWTGSCPCQPFSASGQRKGFADERHLWPAWSYLISQYCPQCVIGEQVASPDGYRWLDLVHADLEGLGYACGATVLPAASVQAPHERHRIWFMAYPHRSGWEEGKLAAETLGYGRATGAKSGAARDVSYADIARLSEREGDVGIQCATNGAYERQDPGAHRHDLSDTNGEPLERPANAWRQHYHWAVEPGMGRVADGVPARVDKLRALGNSIVPQVAAEFIKAAFEVMP